jgi:DNA mismatch repair protein MutS2
VNSHTLKVLEYNIILERLAGHCRSVPGKKLASGLRPAHDIAMINENLDLISEMNDLFKYDGGPPDMEFDQLDERLEQASSSGSLLEPAELLKFSAFFKTVSDFQRVKKKYARIGELASGLVYPEDVHREIERAVDISGSIKDGASPELKRIRREFRLVKEKLDAKFQKYLLSETASYLSDNLFTIREGRYVLPVRETDKGRIQGIIHDRSSSGATFFIEPSETVELNNSHRELETAEREEINRILRRLTEMLVVSLDVIGENIAILARLDFVAGCSRLNRELNGARPAFSEERHLAIKNGRHPILVLNAAGNDSQEVIPLSVDMDDDSCVLIITGPNTGGKTVALKTIGLLTLMAASGLFVPADEGSSFVIFNGIYADIGDEQSIDSSLSTYSSHLSHIRTALDESGGESLVLLDELGAGTDPDEGAAMGQAIVESLSRKKCFAVITTHHGRLKALAGKIEGVINGSMEFDSERLIPTFRFQAGIPGSSYAVEIARRLGLSGDVTERAWKILDTKERDLTRLIGELSKKSFELQDELESARSDRLKYKSLVKIFEDKLKSLKASEKKLRKDQLRATEEIIRQAKDELDRLIKEARKQARDAEALRKMKRDVGIRLEKTEKELEKFKPVPAGSPARGLPGEKVYVVGIEAEGEVLEPADSEGRVRVRVGNVNMVTELEKLIARDTSTAPVAESRIKSDYDPDPGLDLDIRGLTFDEAEPLIQRYIDDASNAALEQVTIIHGKGTGALRKKVQDYLAHNRRVASFRLGNWNEGSSGVTVLTIKVDQ